MALDHGDLPQTAVARPHVLLITTPDHLHGMAGADPSRLDGVGPVSSDTARQVCCDADTTPITIRNSQILDVGRTRRTPTAAQRKAVIARDRTCTGCGAPANRCHIHHITWWRHHGTTNLDNLTLLWTCHHNVHHNNWTTTRAADGHYTTHPPDRPARPDHRPPTWPLTHHPDPTSRGNQHAHYSHLINGRERPRRKADIEAACDGVA